MAEGIIDINNRNEFDTHVLKSNRPVAVDFWAEWCGPCKAIGPILEEVAADTDGSAQVVKVNIDTQTDLAKEYGINTIPTLLYFKDGEIADRSSGLTNKQDITSRLASLN